MKHKHHDVMVAWAADTSIEIECKYNHRNYWYSTEHPMFSEDVEYRIKQKPEYRPYTFDEAKKELKGVYIKHKSIKDLYHINIILEEGIKLEECRFITYDTLFENYEKENGTPLGTII